MTPEEEERAAESERAADWVQFWEAWHDLEREAGPVLLTVFAVAAVLFLAGLAIVAARVIGWVW